MGFLSRTFQFVPHTTIPTMMKNLIETNVREERVRTKELIYKKSHELADKSQQQMSLNARCLLTVEKMKLQLQVLKLQMDSQRQAAAKSGLRITAQAWTPNNGAYSSGSDSEY